MKLAALASSEVGPMKLLQIRTEYAMLLRIKDNRRHGAISYCMVSGEQPNPLQLIDRCTGENCRQCLNNVSGASLRTKAFEQRFRGTCLDRAPTNAKTERGVRVMDAPLDQRLNLDCSAHVSMTIKSHLFSALKPTIVGMKRCAASLRVLGSMMSSRKMFKIV
eukprot:5466588-Pyramimonas_sp.AAC.1